MKNPILIDVDGTITVWDNGRPRLRPTMPTLLECFKLLDQRVIVWSAGGDEYAQFTCDRYGMAPFIDSYLTKPDYPMSAGSVIDILEGCVPVLQLDDDPTEHPEGAKWPFILFSGGHV